MPQPLARLVVLVLVVVPSSLWAESWPVERGPAREPVPFRFRDIDKIDIPKEFREDVGGCYLYAGSSYSIEPDGTVETTVHHVIQLNSRKSLDSFGEFTGIEFDPSYETLTLNEARIHKKTGQVVQARAGDTHLRDVSTDYSIYEHLKELVITFPSLEVGDILEVKWTTRGKHPEYKGHYFNRYLFGAYDYPIARDELYIRVPKRKKLTWASSVRKITPTVTNDQFGTLYRWRIENMPWMPKDENQPSKEEWFPAVAFSTFPDWKRVGSWKAALRKDAWVCTGDLAKIVKEQTKGLADDRAKARALALWVKKNIRYVSIGMGHDFRPYAPQSVYRNRYGDCKDTSQLLAVLLSEAGLRVELATLGAEGDGQIQKGVPSPWGTHAILVVTIDGKEHWIDTTASLCGWDFLPHMDRGRLCYLVDAEGNIRLVRSPVLTSSENRTERSSTVRINSDGTTHIQRTTLSMGIAARDQRDDYFEVPLGERKRLAASALLDDFGKTRLESLTIDDEILADLDKPTLTKMTFTIPEHFSGRPKLEGRISDEPVWSKLLAWNLAHNRTRPFELYAPFELYHRFVVEIPPCYDLKDVPGDSTIRSKWGLFTVRVNGNARSNRIIVESQLLLEKIRVEPSEFEAFRQFQSDVENDYRTWLTLVPTTNKDDIPTLEAVLTKTPDDVDTAIVLAGLYEKLDKNDDARRISLAARKHHPNYVPLLSLEVRTAATAADEEKALRALAEVQPDNQWRKINLATKLISTRRHDEAAKLLQVALEKGNAEQQAYAHYQLARSHYRRDLLRVALQHLDKAEATHAEMVDLLRFHVLRGQTLEELGRDDQAAQAYDRALKVDEKSDWVLDQLTALHLRRGDKQKARHYLKRFSLVIDEDYERLQAARHYLALGEVSESVGYAEQLLSGEFELDAHRFLGLLYLDRAYYEKAAPHLEKAKPDPTIVEGVIRAKLRLGDLDGAARHITDVAKLEKSTFELRSTLEAVKTLIKRRLTYFAQLPKSAQAKANLALGALVCAEYADEDQMPKSMIDRLVDRSLGISKDLPHAVAWRASRLLEEGRLRESRKLAKRVLEQIPTYFMGHLVIGRIELEVGSDKAVDYLRRATELAPTRAETHHHLADAYAERGNWQAAVTAQQKAVALEPSNEEMKARLKKYQERR